MREVVRSAIAELGAKGITESGVGRWGSPVVMVKTSSGAWMLCYDYREANKHVVIPQQPLPRMDDILASFKGKRYFSVMDLCHGFYQIEIEEDGRPKTSFVTPDCQRQYRRLLFCFASSPAIFQRMVDMPLGGMKLVFAIGYIDDIIVYSDTWVDHLAHLRLLFESLRKANLELRPGQCAFGAQEGKYVGHVVTRDGIRACPSKIKAIVEMPRPASAKEVQRVQRSVGNCQYYRKFIPNFSQVAAAVFKAQTARRDFVWTETCDLAWTRLKGALVPDAILALPDYVRDFLLDCDGSGERLGAVLLQAYAEGEKVVAYASRSLLEHEQKWTATELEAAALIWALYTFRPYIDGVHVTIRTHHAPLEYIRSKTDRCKLLERWALRLQEFGFTIQPRPGPQQKHVDALSRAPIPVEANQQPIVLDEFPECMVLLVRSWDERVVALPARGGQDKPEGRGREGAPSMTVQRLAEKAHAQHRGPRCRRGAARLVGHGQQADTPAREESEDDGCQLLLTGGEESDDAGTALVVPGKETDIAMLGTGEGGVALPKAFPRPGRWLSLPIGTPFEIVTADIFGPLKPTARGHTYILVLIDHHTRCVELVALPETTAELVAEAIFERWISRWGTMRALLTDNGRHFTARLLQ